MKFFPFLKSKKTQPATQAATPNNSNWIPENLMSTLGFLSRSKSGVDVTEQTALYTSAVFACQRAISESLAMLPRNIFESTADGGRDKVYDHPSVKVLTAQANRLQTSYKFFETLQHHVLSSGNGYAELQFQRQTGKVVAMWPLPPHRVKPRVIEASGELNLIYEVTTPKGEPVYLPMERVLHIPGIGFDGVQGYPLIHYMVNAIGLGQAVEEYYSKFFEQGANMPGYITVPEGLSEEQLKNMRQHYNLMNEGLANAHRARFLYESAKFTPAGATAEQSQLIQSRVFQIQEVARFYRIPLHKIQEVSRTVGYNSLEQFNIEFVTDTLLPWITNWEQEINRKFFVESKDSNKFVKFNANALLRGDAGARANFYRTMVFSGIMTRNEARALEDLPPVDGGDEMIIPLSMGAGQSDRRLDANERIQD